MKSHELEGRVEKAFNSIKPDILDSVISDIKEGSDKSNNITEFRLPDKKKSRYSYYLRTAAVLVLVLMCFAGFGLYSSAYAVKSTVCIDTGTEAVLRLNSRGKVIEAENVENPETLRGLPLIDAAELILDSALAEGSISADENSLLLSVEDREAEEADELKSLLSAELSARLREKGLEASVMAQTFEQSDELSELSASLGVGPGRAELISGVSHKNLRLSAEALAEMSINELNIIINCTSSQPENLSVSGSASMGLYLDESAARLVAESEIGLSEQNLKNFSIGLGFEDGALVYDMAFDSGIYKYSCTVDALSGQFRKQAEEYSDEFNSWLSNQSDGVRSWVNENSDKIQDLSERSAGDLSTLINDCIKGLGDLAEGVADGVVSLIDLFLS